MDVETRIKQFKQMAEADPDNELGHFSLGKAYLEVQRFDEAAASIARTIEINPRMSKAYQLLGEAFQKAGKSDEAIEWLTRGVKMADEQGDRMPRDAMATMLGELGAEVPESAPRPADSGPTTATATAGGFACSRCGRPAGQLSEPPFRGALGEKIHANICENCWGEWISMGTKVINEMGLKLSDPQCQDAYDQHMTEFLQLDGV